MIRQGNDRQAEQTATVLLSGGVDSTACMKFLQAQGFKIRTFFIDYGQPAAAFERAKAESSSEVHGCAFEAIKVSGPSQFEAGELLGRNAFLVFTALFFLRGAPGILALGLHAGTPYYDCSEAFLGLVNKLVAEHTDGQVSVVAPFLTWSKRDVYRYFVDCGLTLEDTYSCESGVPGGCGSCLSCRDRQVLEC
jgi:7-cyano-7-deazaguanine synthase